MSIDNFYITIAWKRELTKKKKQTGYAQKDKICKICGKCKWYGYKMHQMCILSKKKETTEWMGEVILEKIVAGKFSELMRDFNLHIYKFFFKNAIV